VTDPAEWIKAELRGLRDLAEREREHVVQRFDEVNKLREQVLQERGVFVRHEALTIINDRVARIEQTYITRADHDQLANRLFAIEKDGITRKEFDTHGARLGTIESKVPIMTLVAGILGAIAGAVVSGLILHFFGAR